jgi:hypothetical protein
MTVRRTDLTTMAIIMEHTDLEEVAPPELAMESKALEEVAIVVFTEEDERIYQKAYL